MKGKLLNKTLCILLAAIMVLTLLPVSALAEDVAADIIVEKYGGNPDPGPGTAHNTIDTQRLGAEANTDRFVLNTTRETHSSADTAVSELLSSLSMHYTGTSDGWAAMSMSAYGAAESVAGATIVDNARDSYSRNSDIARSVIALTSLGVDAARVYGGNPGEYLDLIGKLTANPPAGLYGDGALYGLIALDSGDYISERRNDYIQYLLSQQTAEKRWSWGMDPAWDIDLNAEAVAALSPYYADSEGVKAAVDGALAFLSAQQNAGGHYGNSNATAMAIIALSAMGIDPGLKTGDFAKNGNSLIDGLLAFRTSDNRFGLDDTAIASSLSTEQGFRALVAFRGSLLAGGAYNIYHFGPQGGDGTALTGESNPDNEPADPDAPVSMSVRVESLVTGGTLMPETTVSVAGTHLDAVRAALAANDHNPTTSISVSTSGLVSSVLGTAAGPQTGWMYTLNDVVPSTLLIETNAAQGDSLILFFVNYGANFNEPFYIARFDKTTANVKAGESVTVALTGSLVNIWSMEANPFEPISGAKVFAVDSSGKKATGDVVTGLDGKATLTFMAAGSYTIAASRTGGLNANDLIAPHCQVAVEPGNYRPPISTTYITVYFTLRGLSASGDEETWINRMALSDIQSDATAAYVIMQVLARGGYTQEGAADDYIRSVATPGGFILSELYEGMPNSGWLYKVNSTLMTVSINRYTVRGGDHILLYFTKDFTQDEDAGRVFSANAANAPVKDEEEEISGGEAQPADWDNPFKDVSPADWFAAAVAYVHSLGIMKGTAEGEFSPNLPLTRAMLVTILYRLRSGEPGMEGGPEFTDVSDKGAWYYDATQWAGAAGIISGYGDGRFGPNDNVTREQFAVILYNYAGFMNLDTSGTADISAYADAGSVSSWALAAMQWANANGLITGRTEIALVPGGTATRAEAATILHRWIPGFAMGIHYWNVYPSDFRLS